MKKHKIHETGSALVYILIAIALLAALTVSFLGSDTQQSRSQNAFRLATTIENQILFIDSAIQECILTYPRGDASVNSVTTTDAGYVAPYPLTPSSTHFTASTLGPASAARAEFIRCPGNPGGDQNNHEPIFGGSSGKFLPPPPELFDNVIFVNAGSTVVIGFSSTRTDPYIFEAFERVDERFSDCEVAIGVSGGISTLTYYVVGEDPAC